MVKPATGDATAKRSAAIFLYRRLNNLSSREVAAGYFGDDAADAGGRFGARDRKPAEARAIFVATGIMFEEVPPGFDSEPRQSSAQ